MLYLKYGHGKWWHLAYVIASDGTCYATNFLVNSVDSECKMIDQKNSNPINERGSYSCPNCISIREIAGKIRRKPYLTAWGCTIFP